MLRVNFRNSSRRLKRSNLKYFKRMTRTMKPIQITKRSNWLKCDLVKSWKSSEVRNREKGRGHEFVKPAETLKFASGSGIRFRRLRIRKKERANHPVLVSSWQSKRNAFCGHLETNEKWNFLPDFYDLATEMSNQVSLLMKLMVLNLCPMPCSRFWLPLR